MLSCWTTSNDPLRHTSSLAGPSFPYCPEAVTGYTRWYPTGGGQVHIGFPPPARPRSRVPLREVDTSGRSIDPPLDRATTDEDFGDMVLSKAQAVVPRIQAYRDRTASRRDSPPPVDHRMIASLQHQIERLLRERRLRLVNKLIDKLNLGLQEGRSRLKKPYRLRRFAPRWLSSFPPRAQEIPSVTLKSSWPRRPNPLASLPAFIGTVLRTLNRGSVPWSAPR